MIQVDTDVDAATAAWIRNKSDEFAVRNGCRFDVGRGAYTVWWIENTCRLYEGSQSGEPLILRGCAECDYQLPHIFDWDGDYEGCSGLDICLERAARHAECVAAGHRIDWQYDCTMRVFGWTKWSDHWQDRVRRFRKAKVYISKKNKKALAIDTPIPTPSGWTAMGDLKPGDTVFCETGLPCKVIEAHPVIVDDAYRVSLSNGEHIICNGEHLWETTMLQRTVGVGSQGKVFTGNKWTGSLGRMFQKRGVRTTAEIAATLLRPDGARNHSIQLQLPLVTKAVALPMDPYVLGMWLGDGDSDAGRVTCCKEDFEVYQRELANAGYSIPHRVIKGNNYRFTFQSSRDHRKTRTTLKYLGLFQNKHIPPIYLRASVEQRTALLQGLMDTDGCINKNGKNLTYVTKLKVLADGVAELLSSLGVKHSTRIQRPIISGVERAYYWIQFHAFRDEIAAFRLERKLNRMRSRSALTMRARSDSLQIVGIERVPQTAVRCITVDNPTGMFLCGRTMVPTHNSPTLSAWSLYMTCGDGEPGQHVYLCAKDGQQVRENTAKHIVNMLDQSEDLKLECVLNKSTLQITHEPTRSTCHPLSSSNVRTQKSKEGLNGSVFVDETHVVDREFISRIDRAGISRKEPLHAEFSTAGDDPDSYGKEQFDKCQKIISGETEDQDTFAAVYAAPQDLTDADLAADPLKYGLMANPAMGHTVDPAEYLADYTQSKNAPATLATFKMYRLDIWQNSASPWLPADGWDKGAREYTHESLQGRNCWGGLDLAFVTDFAALCLAFPEDEDRIKHLWWFWLPEETARKVKHKMPIDEWVADKRTRLFLTPGARVHFGAIRATVRELHKQYIIHELAYDDWNAEQTTQEISEGVTDNNGKVIEPGTGIVRVNFSQGLQSMNEPTKRFEGRVIDGCVEHNGDPLARWMALNATIKPDTNGNYKPIKQRDMMKKIDGVPAAIMADARASMGADTHNYYETHEVEFV